MPGGTGRRVAAAMLLCAAIIWGGGFVAGKLALETLSPTAILAWRFLGAALLCGLMFRNRLCATPRATIRGGCAIGVLQLAALSLQLLGLTYTTAAKQSFLCTAYVVLTPFLSAAILRTRLSLRAVAAGMISLAGIGLICLSNGSDWNRGDLLSLAFSVLFGIQVVLTGRFMRGDTDPVQLSFWHFLSAGLLALLLSIVTGNTLFCFSAGSLVGILYLAILNTLVAFILQNAAQKKLSDTVSALIISLESVFGFLFSVLWFRESLTLRLLVGAALCFLAILLASVGHSANNDRADGSEVHA